MAKVLDSSSEAIGSTPLLTSPSASLEPGSCVSRSWSTKFFCAIEMYVYSWLSSSLGFRWKPAIDWTEWHSDGQKRDQSLIVKPCTNRHNDFEDRNMLIWIGSVLFSNSKVQQLKLVRTDLTACDLSYVKQQVQKSGKIVQSMTFSYPRSQVQAAWVWEFHAPL